MSKISNMFQQNRPNILNKQFGLQAPLNNILNKVADRTIEMQQKNSDYEFEEKVKEIKADTYTKVQTSETLEELEPDVLKYYAASLKFLSGLSSDHEQELSSFKEQLMSFDQGIQTCQDVINGNVSLPDGVTMDDMKKLLTEKQQAREKYLKDGCGKINKWNLYKSDFFNRTVNKVFGENKFSESDEKDWKIDAAASDIYAEIDRVAEATRGITQTLNEGISRIYDILEKKGYGEEKYKLHQAMLQKNRNPFPDSEGVNSLQLFLASLKSKAIS